jgi:hypothetical protein
MEKMKLLATLVCAIAVLAFAAPALAQNDEAEVDWDEAIEFAEVTDTYVENNVEWETYYDELQNVMWSQPADATPEAVKAYLSGDQDKLEDLGLDWEICIVNWPLPYSMTIDDDHGNSPTFTYNDFYVSYSSSTSKIWTTTISAPWYDVDGSVASSVRTTSNYCGNYQNLMFGGGAGGVFSPDNSNCIGPLFGYYYLWSSDSSHVEDWYYTYGITWVARHRFYACDAYRNVYTSLGVGPE